MILITLNRDCNKLCAHKLDLNMRVLIVLVACVCALVASGNYYKTLFFT